MFNEEDYSNFKLFFNEIQRGINGIRVIIDEAITEKEQEEDFKNKVIVYQEIPVSRDELKDTEQNQQLEEFQLLNEI